MPQIFISYSHVDSDFMYRLRSALEPHFTIWVDENLEVGTPSWKSAIADAIEHSDGVIAVFTPNAKQSKWVKEELEYAEGQNKHIFYVLADGDRSNAVPFGFMGSQWADMRSEQSYAPEMEKLLGSIHKTLEPTNDKYVEDKPAEITDKIIHDYFLFDKRHRAYVEGKTSYTYRGWKNYLLASLSVLALSCYGFTSIVQSSKNLTFGVISTLMLCGFGVLPFAIVFTVPYFIKVLRLHRRYSQEGKILTGKVTEINQHRVRGKDVDTYTMTYQFFNPDGIEKTGTTDYRQPINKRTRILPTKYRTPIKVIYLDSDNFFPL